MKRWQFGLIMIVLPIVVVLLSFLVVLSLHSVDMRCGDSVAWKVSNQVFARSPEGIRVIISTEKGDILDRILSCSPETITVSVIGFHGNYIAPPFLQVQQCTAAFEDPKKKVCLPNRE